MSGVDNKFIEELKSKINIVEVIGRYCSLKRNGPSNFWACCPLPGHVEKTPSFCVNEPGQFYYCFGCHKTGDVIKFIQEEENLTFFESVSKLADMYKIPMPQSDNFDEEESKRRKNEKDRAYEILNKTARFYLNNLRSEAGGEYYNYLIKRGFTNNIITSFGLGASLDFESLPNYLKNLGYTEQEILNAGVCSRGKNGKLYDFEAKRLIVPIINNVDKVIAFGGRSLEKNPTFGKYKNTADTMVFNKKRVIYNINKLHKLIKTEKIDYVIMVEGYMDVIALTQAGIKNVVASMGTQLTLEQARLLKRYTNKVIVSYDGDFAGQEATLRSLNIFANEGFEVKILTLPNKLDPDEVIKQQGVGAYLKLVDEAMPLIDYKLHVVKQGKNLQDVTDKRKYVSECLEIIKAVGDTFLQEELLKQVAKEANLTYQSLKNDLDKGTVTVVSTPMTIDENYPKIEDNSLISKAERFILASLIFKKPYAKVDEELYFNNEHREKIYEKLLFDKNLMVESLHQIVGEQGAMELTAILVALDGFDKSIEEKYFKDCVYNVKKYNIENEIKRLNVEYEKEIDLEKRAQIGNMIAQLTLKLKRL